MSVSAGDNTLIDAATGAPFPAVPANTLLGRATYAARLQAGDEAFRQRLDQQFFG